MKLHLPKTLLIAVLCAMVAGFSYAESVVPASGEIVSTKADFLDASTSNIFFDGEEDVIITESVSKRQNNLYVRKAELKFSGVSEHETTVPIVTLGNLVVSGNDACVTFDKVNYSSTAALNHVGGIDGNGTLNIINGTKFDSDAEVFTIGVQGNQVGNGSEGSSYSDGTYDEAGNGRGEVNIIDSTAKLTYRHLQIGEGALNVINSSVTIGNKEGESEYYKGFKASLGMGENTTSTIKVAGNGASLTVYAAQNGNYLGGFSTNVSDNSKAHVEVDGGSFSVLNPVNADPVKYPEGRNGDTYIGFSFYGELDEYTKNATTNIDIKNGGTVNFENHTTSFGYAGMKDNGTSVCVTLHDSDSTLNVRSKDVFINEGVTIDNKGKINIDTTYENNLMQDGSMAIVKNRVAIYGGVINNHEGATINVENDIVIGEQNYGSSIEQKSVVINSGDIKAEEITFKGDCEVTNDGTITTTYGDIIVAGSSKLTNSGILSGYLNISGDANVSNSGVVNATTYLNGADAVFNAGDGSSMKKVFLSSGTFSVEGTVTLEGNYASYYPSNAILVFSEGAALKMDGYNATLDGVTIKLTENGSRSSALISLGSDGSCSVGAGAEVVLSLTDAYLDKLTSEANNVSILFADSAASSTDASITVNEVSTSLWDVDENSFEWKVENGQTWMIGSVKAVTDIDVDSEPELTESITDVTDGTKRSVTVEDAAVTLSGDNTHTGGTAISNGAVTLESATALGAGAVSTSGTSSITAADGVEAVLPGAIANKDGELTLSGTFDASALEAEVIGETYLGTDLTPGENGFFRHEGSSIQLVENDNAFVSENSDAVIKHDNGITYTLEGTDGLAVAHGDTLWHTYHINTAEHDATVSEIAEASKDDNGNVQLEQVEMKAGTLNADRSIAVNAAATTDEAGDILLRGTINMSGADTELSGSIADAIVNASGGKLSAELSGTTEMTVTGEVEINGENSHTGTTTIAGEGAKLTVGSEKALGDSLMELQDHGTLDLNHMAVDNAINVSGCTLENAENYQGRMGVSGDLKLTGPTTAESVMLMSDGKISGASLRTKALEVNIYRDFVAEFASISSDVTINDGGVIVLYGGTELRISGSLTLGNNMRVVLMDDGEDFAAGDTLVSCLSGTITGDVSTLEFIIDGKMQDGYVVEITDDRKSIVLAEEEGDTPIVDPDVPVQPDPAPVFDQATADVLAQGNWGIFTASRAFVNAVQGQRNSMGCIANGRGTAWAALLGATHDIDGSGAAAGSDTTLFGAAVGVDMQVGKRSSLGVAFGYTDAEVKPGGLADVDQEGGYIALYGEHGLKKFANNSCLALDWVLATGTTESSYLGSEWEQDHIQANTRLTWTKKVNERFAYNVFGGVEYFASESDRVAGCKSGSIQNLRGELGVGARYVVKQGQTTACDGKGGLTPVAPGCERIVVYGELSYINDMVRNNPSIEVDGLRGGGANPGRQGVGIEAGATFRIGERWSANANYSFNAMDDSNEHVLNIGASRTF